MYLLFSLDYCPTEKVFVIYIESRKNGGQSPHVVSVLWSQSFDWLGTQADLRRVKGKQQATLVSRAQFEQLHWRCVGQRYEEGWAVILPLLAGTVEPETYLWNTWLKWLFCGASNRAVIHKLADQLLPYSLNCSKIFIVLSLTPIVPISRKSHQKCKIHKINGEAGLYKSESSF